ncbi:chloride channel protein [Streptomyces sp. NPDC001732]
MLDVLSLRLALPALATCCIATAVSWPMLPNGPTYQLPEVGPPTSLTVFAVLIGPLAGLIAVGWVRMIRISHDHRPMGWGALVAPLLVFTVVGVLAVPYPELLGNGKDIVQLTLSAQVAAPLLVALLFLEPIATAGSLGSGVSGGLFTPPSPPVPCSALWRGRAGHKHGPPRHPDLPPPQRVTQRHKHAQLVRDALDPAALVHHRLAPFLAYHPGQRDLLRLVEERALLRDELVQIPLEQVDRVHHRPVGGVVALQLQRVQQWREHPPPVVGVRRTQHRAPPGPVGGLARCGLRRQRLQRGLPGHRIDHLADRATRLRDRRLRQPQQDALLAADPLELLAELALDLLLRPSVDLLYELDEQLHQRVGDLRFPPMA